MKILLHGDVSHQTALGEVSLQVLAVSSVYGALTWNGFKSFSTHTLLIEEQVLIPPPLILNNVFPSMC